MLININPLSITHFLRFRKKKIIGSNNNFELSSRRYNGNRFADLIVEDIAIKTGKALKQCPHIRATLQRFQDKLDWRETEYIQLYETWYRKIDNEIYKERSFEDFYEHRLKTWDSIFNDTKSEGYKASINPKANVEIAMNEYGQPLLIDGRHRVAFAQVLRLPEIPVIVNIISENLARSFANANFANSFSDKNIARAFETNSSRLSEQLRQDGIKSRLITACQN